MCQALLATNPDRPPTQTPLHLTPCTLYPESTGGSAAWTAPTHGSSDAAASTAADDAAAADAAAAACCCWEGAWR